MTVQQYQLEHEKLMTEWENEARSWLSEIGEEELAKNIPFFRDGVTCPEVWFDKDNTFRPLFILKEVSIGKNYKCYVHEFLKTWGNKKTFEFAQYEFDDIKVGSFPQWMRIARLAKAFEEVHKGKYPCDYGTFDMRFRDKGELYVGEIPGYKDPKGKNYKKTTNTVYNDIINKIAVLELKKVGAGQNVSSELSLATGYYTSRIKKYKEKICKQIDLIKPTVIIGLGRENGECITRLLKDNGIEMNNIIVIEGYHHSRSSNEKFYDCPLRQYREERMKL